MSSVKLENDEWNQQLIDAYVRAQSITVPRDIRVVIFRLYDKARYFDKYNKERFEVSQGGTIIKAIGPSIHHHTEHTIYPSQNGFTTGTHTWSVKYLRHNGKRAYKDIGVATKKERLFWNGSWKLNETITVSVNMNTRIVKHFKAMLHHSVYRRNLAH